MRGNYFYQLFHFYNKVQIIYNLPNIHFKNFIINTALCIKSIVNIIKKNKPDLQCMQNYIVRSYGRKKH